MDSFARLLTSLESTVLVSKSSSPNGSSSVRNSNEIKRDLFNASIVDVLKDFGKDVSDSLKAFSHENPELKSPVSAIYEELIEYECVADSRTTTTARVFDFHNSFNFVKKIQSHSV